MKQFFDCIREKLTGSNVANAAILRVYRDSLLDNSIQPCSEDPAIQARVKELRDQLADLKVPLRLGELYRIEAELWNYFTESTVLARFWAVRDRFSRVASAESQAKYDQTVPATTDPKWAEPEFARNQALALIDAIQSNQLINLEREKFANVLRRTVFGIGIILIAILLVIFVIAAGNGKHPLLTYYGMMFFLGMLGACISYIRRLQNAVDHNALTGDGLAELHTIATNRVTALSSLMVGGVFAIVLYWLVLSSAFAALVPAGNASPGLSTSSVLADTMLKGLQAEEKLLGDQLKEAQAINPPNAALVTSLKDQLAAKTAEVLKQQLEMARIDAELASVVPGTRLPDAAKTDPDCTEAVKAPPATTPTSPAPPKPQPDAAAKPGTQASTGAVNNAKAPPATTPANTGSPKPQTAAACPLGAGAFAKNSAETLGLADARSFYLMLILAFLAGFAEQLVPDALDKLSRRLNKGA